MKYVSEERLGEILEDIIDTQKQDDEYARGGKTCLAMLIALECKELNPWLPICDAPKDRRILGWFPHRKEAFVIRFDMNIYDPEENWTLDDGESASRTHGEPTHYQELPEAPKE